MKRILAAAALAVLLAVPAFADTHYYVRQNGADNAQHDGLANTDARAWSTMSYAVAHVVQANTANGHVIIHVSGQSSAGGSWGAFASAAADGKRYFVIGSSLTNPAASAVAAVNLRTSYVSIKGVTINGSVTIGSDAVAADTTVSQDSLLSCVWRGGIYITGDYNVLYNNTIGGGPGASILIGNLAGVRTVSNKLVENRITIGSGVSGTDMWKTGKSTTGDIAICDSLVVSRNIIFERTDPGAGEVCFRMVACTYNPVFEYNKWYITNYANNEAGGFRIRDGSRNITMNCDTIYAQGSSSVEFEMSQCCNNIGLGKAVPPVRNWTIDSCYINNQTSMPAMTFTSGVRGLNMTYTTLATAHHQAVIIQGDSLVLANTINHCTIVGRQEPGSIPSDPGAGALIYAWDLDNFHASATLAFTNNLIVNASINWMRDVFCFTAGTSRSAVQWSHVGSFPTFAGLSSDFNAYCIQSFGDEYGDRSIRFYDGNQGYCSEPGDASVWDNTTNLAARDSNSVAGTPAFAYGGAPGILSPYGTGSGTVGTIAPADTLPGLHFSPLIGPSSIARGNGSGASDIGAVAYSGVPDLRVVVCSPPSEGADPLALDFTATPHPGFSQGTIAISNVGTEDADITAITLTHVDSTTFYGFTPLPITVTAGTTQYIQFNYATTSEGILLTTGAAEGALYPGSPAIPPSQNLAAYITFTTDSATLPYITVAASVRALAVEY